MVPIIAGRFDSFAQVRNVKQLLRTQGIADEAISIFYVNPPGQHDLPTAAGDQPTNSGENYADTDALTGAAGGAAAGLAFGLAAAAATGPSAPLIAAGVGGYTGSLTGVLSGLSDDGDYRAALGHVRPREACVVVAINVSGLTNGLMVVSVLHKHGGQDIEQAWGQWRAGQWADFDPRTLPSLINEGGYPNDD